MNACFNFVHHNPQRRTFCAHATASSTVTYSDINGKTIKWEPEMIAQRRWNVPHSHHYHQSFSADECFDEILSENVRHLRSLPSKCSQKPNQELVFLKANSETKTLQKKLVEGDFSFICHHGLKVIKCTKKITEDDPDAASALRFPHWRVRETRSSPSKKLFRFDRFSKPNIDVMKISCMRCAGLSFYYVIMREYWHGCWCNLSIDFASLLH